MVREAVENEWLERLGKRVVRETVKKRVVREAGKTSG